MILPQMCLDCRHAHWPQHSAGECHAPTVPPNTTTRDARAQGGSCGNAGILWEKTNDENT
jgi:hypothetical protein